MPMQKERLARIALGAGEIFLHSYGVVASLAVIHSFITGYPIMPLDLHAVFPIIPAPIENPLPLPFVGGGAVGAEFAARYLGRARRSIHNQR